MDFPQCWDLLWPKISSVVFFQVFLPNANFYVVSLIVFCNLSRNFFIIFFPLEQKFPQFFCSKFFYRMPRLTFMLFSLIVFCNLSCNFFLSAVISFNQEFPQFFFFQIFNQMPRLTFMLFSLMFFCHFLVIFVRHPFLPFTKWFALHNNFPSSIVIHFLRCVNRFLVILLIIAIERKLNKNYAPGFKKLFSTYNNNINLF